MYCSRWTFWLKNVSLVILVPVTTYLKIQKHNTNVEQLVWHESKRKAKNKKKKEQIGVLHEEDKSLILNCFLILIIFQFKQYQYDHAGTKTLRNRNNSLIVVQWNIGMMIPLLTVYQHIYRPRGTVRYCTGWVL